MTDSVRGVGGYLERLEQALEALGPDETREVIAEVRGMLQETDAAEEAGAAAGDDPATALARFGSPEEFAQRILEERGIAAHAPRLPQAPLPIRVAAGVIDALSWLFVAIVVLGAAFTGLTMIGHWPLDADITLMRFAVVAVSFLVVLTWWWLRKRRTPGFSSLGMRALGIRRIRVGESTRVVRSRDIPGGVTRRRALAVIASGVLLAVLALFVSAATWLYVTESRFINEHEYSGLANAVVVRAYEDVRHGGDGSLLRASFNSFSPSALEDMAALQQRYADGSFESYDVGAGRIVEEYGEITVIVPITERSPDNRTLTTYAYSVRLIRWGDSPYTPMSAWLIDSVEEAGQQ